MYMIIEIPATCPAGSCPSNICMGKTRFGNTITNTMKSQNKSEKRKIKPNWPTAKSAGSARAGFVRCLG